MAVPFELPPPPVVRQNDPQGCWAASFNSWSRAQGLRSAPTEESMIRLFSGVRNALNGNNSVTESGLSVVSQLAFMALERVRGVRLTSQYLGDLLERRGYIYLAYRPIRDGGGGGHVVVVYGVNNTHALVMDPDSSVNFPCHVPIDWYIRRSHAVVGTPIYDTRNIRNPFV